MYWSGSHSVQFVNRERFLVYGSFQKLYGGSTMQGSYSLNSSHVCGANGSIGAVTKVHCLCDVICCLAVDQERLQGSFS
jgi:hypothetical protein